MTGIERAIAAAGSETQLGDALGVTQQAVNKMKRRGYCPPDRARQIAGLYPDIPVRTLIDPDLAALMEEEQ